jgi:hypothetical protein
VVLVDGARFLPANITITQVVVGVWSSQVRASSDVQ